MVTWAMPPNDGSGEFSAGFGGSAVNDKRNPKHGSWRQRASRQYKSVVEHGNR